ncbi:FtsX-like permease family protein [Bacillus sp. 31A1R]|uniref:FtsX-like permease family protein n=1 Tax=Robertmurraya mangrovi TaxID=3098077 RepID=A0ABU5IW12_9BACI|nr:FtsX-like permease family protein [Bacillus sp. 31A1R]MDZ5471335.1 FtsX-like permease family protein [Bacillus sp. 31A1R]
MKHYTSLNHKYMMKQWKRTILSIIGIALSVCLMSFTLIFTTNLKETIYNSTKYSSGFYHFSIKNPSHEQETILKLHEKIERVGVTKVKRVGLQDAQAAIQLMSIDHTGMEIFKETTLLRGGFPKNEDEIVLEDWLAQKWMLKMGDSIRIENLTFKLVGVSKDQLNSKANEVSIGYLIEKHQILKQADKHLYVQFYEEYINQSSDLNILIDEVASSAILKKSEIKVNAIVDKALMDYKSRDYSALFIFIFNLIVMGVFIYNTFQITVMERIHQYGIIRSLGATPKQILHIVLNEAILISFISIPLGLGMGVLLQRLLQYISFFSETINPTLPVSSLVGACLFSLIVIIFSVYRPAKAASKVSPISAVKMNDTSTSFKGTNARVRSYFLDKLGVSPHLAWQNITRNRARFISATLSMSIGIVLIILNFSFFSSQDPAALLRKNYLWDANYYISKKTGYTDQDIRDLEKLLPINHVFPSKYTNVELVKENNIAPKNIQVYGYHPEMIRKAEAYVVDGKINLEKIESGKEIIIMVPDKENVIAKPGQSIIIKNSEGQAYTLKVGAIVENYPVGGDRERTAIIIDSTYFETIHSEGVYHRLDLAIEENEKNHAEIYNSLKDFAEGGRIKSLFENMKSIERDFETIQVLMVGFICIISIIGIFSIYNTLSTSYLLRKNEFGVLRAIGMTKSQLRNMVVWEGLFYGLFSCSFGCILGLILHYLQYRIINLFITGFFPQWNFPMLVLILVSVTFLILCVITSLLSSKPLKSDSIMESIKLVN